MYNLKPRMKPSLAMWQVFGMYFYLTTECLYLRVCVLCLSYTQQLSSDIIADVKVHVNCSLLVKGPVKLYLAIFSLSCERTS